MLLATTRRNLAVSGENPVKSLRDAASAAHRAGDIDAAVAIYEKILALFPETAEAVDAAFYLSSIGRGRRRAPRRAEESTRMRDDSLPSGKRDVLPSPQRGSKTP